MARLTKRAVDAAEATGSGWSWFGDDEVPGFGLIVYPSGTKTFSLRYRTRSGRQRMMKLGQYGELTVQEARDMARKEKVRVLEGEDPRAEREREAVEVRTVNALLDAWLEDYAKAHRKRWEDDARRLDARIRPPLGSLALEDLTPSRLADYHRRIGVDEGSPVEANRCVETIRAAWRWAEREGRLPEGLTDPTKRVKRFRERSRDRWLRRDELDRLMEAARSEEDPFVRAVVPLLVLTGLRKGELLSARWEHVDLDRGELRLPETKSGEAQVRILTEPAIRILRELPSYEESPFVFPSPKNPRSHRKDIKRQWETIRQEADLEDVTMHDLRRTAGSYMAQAGVPLQVIQKVLGHSHPAVTKLYARLASENERQALETLADRLSGLMDEPASPTADQRRHPINRLVEEDAGRAPASRPSRTDR